MIEQNNQLAELQNEIIRLNKIIASLIKQADSLNADQMTDFNLFKSQIMLEDEVHNRTEQLENALKKNKSINAELINTQHKMQQEIEERKLMQQALEQEKAEQKALIQQLEESDRQLRQSEKLASIGQLAAGVAHEINNPMGYITSNLSSLQRYFHQFFELITLYEELSANPSNTVWRDEIQRLREEIDLDFLREDIGPLFQDSIEGAVKVRRIIQDLLHFSRAGENQWEWVNLHDGLNSTLNIISNELKYKTDVILDYGKIPLVYCMPTQINQVLMNMLLNAAHAIDIHGEIRIKTGQTGEQVYISISDTGCGMTPEIKAKIFDPFFTTKRVGSGTGLGLSVAYGIIKKHQGRIDVESELGKGSVFTVWLPIAPVTEPEKVDE
jgi:Signal transduction histidine kinase regulating C4-dicarboxylate transport system